jgi:hypothetical protein
MADLAAHTMCGYSAVIGRLAKPFNPLLGETYELVTADFRFISECVSHHPPVFALHLETENFSMDRITQTTQRFTGKRIEVVDNNKGIFNVKYKKPDSSLLQEQYSITMPTLVVGNLIIGDRFLEP